MSKQTFLILPGLNNSDAAHWQTLWEATIPNTKRVIQGEWDRPVCKDWVATLQREIQANEGTVILVAHSLGCALVAAWAAEYGVDVSASKVKGALLVAPPDVERVDFPASVTGFAPMPRVRLPFKSIVIASSNDPWCDVSRAQEWAGQWGAVFHQIGAKGHINGESGLSSWTDGQRLLFDLSIP